MLRLWPLICLLCLLSLLAILGLTPNDELDAHWPAILPHPSDKFMHGGGFFGIAWLLCQSGVAELVPTQWLQRISLPAVLILMAFGSELLQSCMPYRQWDWQDVWWNLAGAAAGLTIYVATKRLGRHRPPFTILQGQRGSYNDDEDDQRRVSQQRTLVELEEINVLVHQDR